MDKEQRIAEIDKRIQDLEQHREMWRKAGGHGKNMALQAFGEIRELELEKEDLINGTNNLKLYKLEKEKKRLEALKEDANFIKKMRYKKELENVNKELQAFENTPVEEQEIDTRTSR